MTSDPDTIYETDIDETGALAEADEQARMDWEYWAEVRECCGGTDWACGHWRSYPPPIERDDH